MQVGLKSTSLATSLDAINLVNVYKNTKEAGEANEGTNELYTAIADIIVTMIHPQVIIYIYNSVISIATIKLAFAGWTKSIR